MLCDGGLASVALWATAAAAAAAAVALCDRVVVPSVCSYLRMPSTLSCLPVQSRSALTFVHNTEQLLRLVTILHRPLDMLLLLLRDEPRHGLGMHAHRT